MNMTLVCQGYRTQREINEPLRINVDFVLLGISPRNTKDMGEAVKKIELFLSGKVDLVRADPDKLRCFYCGSLNDIKDNQCTQCGASL